LLQTGDEVKAVLQVPLRTEGRAIGLLSVDRQDSPAPFDKHDELMLAILADYVVIALEIYQVRMAETANKTSGQAAHSALRS
jgi:GAF domain-containing protein